MGNSCTTPRTDESSFGFGFNNVKFSDRTLKLEIVPPDQDDHDSESNSNFKEQYFYIDSLLLAARSPFFRKLLDNGMKESHDKGEITLRIKASEEAAVLDLLKFIYGKPLKASSEAELLDLLIVADKYEVSSCIRHCIQIMGKLLTVESSLLYLELPSMVFVSEEVKPLLDQVKKYLSSHFEDFTKSQQAVAMKLPLLAIEAVLGGERLRVDSEEDVYNFALKWARLHFPELKERREILTNRLAPLICFENISCSKLKSYLGCPDFDRESISLLIFDALSSKVEAPYSKCLERKNTNSPRRVYKRRFIKVVHLELAQPSCVVYFDLRKEDCADLVPSQTLCSQTFCLAGESFYLCATRDQDKDTLGVYAHKIGGSETCTLDVHFSAMSKVSKQFRSLEKFVHVVERNKGLGYPNLFKTPWEKLMRDESENFIDGMLHLRADITFIK